jgi:hypothetical protein
MNIFQKLSLISCLLAAFTVPGMAGVIVNSPYNGSSVSSPFSLSA